MITRRWILKAVAVSGAASAFAATVPGLRIYAQSSVPERRSLKEMDLNDPILKTYREFVTMMKDPARASDSMNWGKFADVHGSLGGGFHLCPHNNWYFLPWHRSYIRMYEIAARVVTGNQDFAMPFWDWTQQPELPAALGDEQFDGKPNPLFVPGRAMRTGDKIAESVAGPMVMDSIYGNETFEEFGSSRAFGQDSLGSKWIKRSGVSAELEYNPHNNVHCDVAGPFMCSGASPRDPIFQMHHCNVDRIWAEWISKGRANSSDQLWLDMPFTDNFINPDGGNYTDIVKNLLNVENLGYTYGLEAPQDEQTNDPARDFFLATLFGSPASLETGGIPRQIVNNQTAATQSNPLVLELAANSAILNRAIDSESNSALESAGLQKRQVYAFLRNIDVTNSDFTQLRVFVNLNGASESTDTTNNPNYVTSVGFFGPNSTHGGHDIRKSVAINLTPALKRIKDTPQFDANAISVQLVAVPQQQGATPGTVTPTEVELAIV